MSAAENDRAELDREVLALIRAGVTAPRDDARFAELALRLFRHQYRHGAAYRRLCESAGMRSERLDDWRRIPPVPTGAFKQARLACFPPGHTRHVFRTSGTTTQSRGELHLDTLELYEASLRETFRAFICPDFPAVRARFFVLAPSPQDAPDSSLSHMFGVAVRELAAAGSTFHLHADPARAWDPAALLRDLGRCDEPALVAGTAFAFVHLLDHMTEHSVRIELPAGSRVMETGGFKGRSREVPREELHAQIAARLGVDRARIVNQYGMCELGSQLYEPALLEGHATDWKIVPPWVRSRALDPATLDDVPEGEPGVLAHYDLANTGSVLAVLTSDLGRIDGDRLQVLGRVTGAEARGCSLAADALLSGA